MGVDVDLAGLAVLALLAYSGLLITARRTNTARPRLLQQYNTQTRAQHAYMRIPSYRTVIQPDVVGHRIINIVCLQIIRSSTFDRQHRSSPEYLPLLVLRYLDD